MPNSVEHFLFVYQRRKSMQDKGATNPPDSVKKFTSSFVEVLKRQNPSDMVEIVKDQNRATRFVLVKNGEVLGELQK
ncbi:hypothetical protein ISG33_14445 [Glaciecola sp. MH2013]|uniref:hypothetical protein n=1 Tax=Glaciecola sp. MH2013 TaxID=2785524 RepID=UPI0018A05BEB|nr:hypothetical protein [Glaciecola sp. MH2013]MBF7074602.1 hypothetical protein [Glaciecola sp. MH2013]